jgi:hypothetical protein
LDIEKESLSLNVAEHYIDASISLSGSSSIRHSAWLSEEPGLAEPLLIQVIAADR